MHSDPIADMLTQIRNGLQIGKESVELSASKLKSEIARILKDEGFILGFEDLTDKGQFKRLKVNLKYFNKKSVILGLKRVSKPGLRYYVGKKEIPRVVGGMGVAILSTSQGIMTDKEARYRNVGGEVLCFVW